MSANSASVTNDACLAESLSTSPPEHSQLVDQIVARMREGKPLALAELFELFQDRLLRLIDVRINPHLRARIDPDDILQEAYVDAAQRVEGFLADSSASPAVWLRLIVLQRLQLMVRSHLLTQKRDSRREVPFGNNSRARFGSGIAGSFTTPSKVASRNESIEKVELLLSEMPEPDREILTLRHFEQLSNKEVAEVLGISVTAANNRYTRAITRLKMLFDRQVCSATNPMVRAKAK